MATKKMGVTAWAVVDTGALRDTTAGELTLRDGRLPLFWLRSVALRVAREWGFTTSGRKRDVRICKVSVRAMQKRPPK